MTRIAKFKAPLLRFWHLMKFPLLIGILIGLLASNLIISANQSRETREANHRAELADQRSRESQKQIEDLILCIVQFYQKPVRTGLYLESVEDCRFERRVSRESPQEPSAPSVATPKIANHPSQKTPTPPSPAPRIRTEDRSFLDCLPKQARKRLNKVLPKDHPLRRLPC